MSVAVLLLCNDALHTQNPAELHLRVALATSGLLKAVIALPGRIFLDGRPPSSLLVLANCGSPLSQTLFVDLQESGQDIDLDSSQNRRLALSAEGNLAARTSAQRQAIAGADPEAPAECGGRVLPPQAVQQALETYRLFTNQGARFASQPGLAASASRSDLKTNDWLLTAWTYVQQSPANANQPPADLELAAAISAYAHSRITAQQELENLLMLSARPS
jgi:type I restriction-modification system DNA methylase subunit